MRNPGTRRLGAMSRQTHRRELATPADVSIAAESADQVILHTAAESIQMQTRAVGEAGLELVGGCYFPKNTFLDIVFPEVVPPPLVDFMADPGLRIKTVVRKIQMIGPEPEYAIWLHLTHLDEATKAEWDALVDPMTRSEPAEPPPDDVLGGEPVEPPTEPDEREA